MAVENAETVAYTLIHSLLPAVPEPYSSDPPTASPEVTTTNESHAAIVQAWEVHRFARVKKVVDFTTKNGDLRNSSPHFYDQAAKEWLIWAMFKLMGDEGDARWMYRDNAETVRAVLPYRAGLAVRSIYLTIVMKI